MHRSPRFYLTAEENPEKSQLCDVNYSDGVSYLQMTSVGFQSMLGIENEVNKERVGIELSYHTKILKYSINSAI